MSCCFPFLFAALSFPALAAEIRWAAQGTVTSGAAGFSAAAGDPVSVKFSYDTGVTRNIRSYLPIGESLFSRTEFYGAVALKTEVTIGVSKWTGTLADSPIEGVFALYSEAWDGAGTPDTFTVLVSSLDPAVFDLFPYTGAGTGREIKFVFQDTTAPTGFLAATFLPTDNNPASQITVASGSVTAGNDRIQFTIDPATVTIESDEPKFPLSIQRTLTGIELRWPTVEGTTYRLEESDTPDNWQPYGSYPGSGADIVVTLNPFGDHPRRRFYRVVTE
jgi:hypothetical protein